MYGIPHDDLETKLNSISIDIFKALRSIRNNLIERKVVDVVLEVKFNGVWRVVAVDIASQHVVAPTAYKSAASLFALDTDKDLFETVEFLIRRIKRDFSTPYVVKKSAKHLLDCR